MKIKSVPKVPRTAFVVNMAVRFLEENSIKSLPFDIPAVIKAQGWKLIKFSSLLNADDLPYTCAEICEVLQTENGFSIPDPSCDYIIAYNDISSLPTRIRFTLCHEIGHCFLGHFREFDYKNLSFSSRLILDKEADIFARNILMPVIICDSLRNLTDHKTQYIFDVSFQAMQTRRRSLAEDRMLLNEDSLNCLAAMFLEYMYSLHCKDCGFEFIDKEHSKVCPACASTNLIWLHHDDYHKRLVNGQKGRNRLQPFASSRLPVDHRTHEEKVEAYFNERLSNADKISRKWQNICTD